MVGKLALKAVLLTGQRGGEITGLTWSELDLEKNVWRIPAARMKNKVEHVLPLTPMFREVLDQCQSFFGDENPYVFPSSHKEEKHIDRHSLSRAVNRHYTEMGIEDAFTPHDIRRTVRTRLAELQIAEFIAERILGHKLQGMLAVYNQHDYLAEKRQALERWESTVRKIVGLDQAPDNIVRIRKEENHA